MPDTKAHAIDGMSASAVRRLGKITAYKYFCQWTNKRLDKKDNDLVSTARITFLSKTGNEVVSSHKDYRVLAIQSTFMRILECLIMNQVNHEKVRIS